MIESTVYVDIQEVGKFMAQVATGAKLFAAVMKGVYTLQQYFLILRMSDQNYRKNQPSVEKLLPELVTEWHIQRSSEQEKTLRITAQFAQRVQFTIKPAASMGEPTDQTGLEVDVEFCSGEQRLLCMNIGWSMHKGAATSCNLCMRSPA
ncbi:MAG: hypothetical protein PHC70_03265 [Patescibacteria group bacterium]|nr:hypothetical protein [Patescibacteria group bacterium]